MHEDDQIRKILEELAKKVGEQFLNPKQYVLLPVSKSQQINNNELMFNIA